MQPKTRGTILVTDDDKDMRNIVRRMMAAEGYNIIEAANGAECIRLFEEHLPDAILLDAMMPGMDGFTVCENLQKLPEGRRTPILMTTALNDDHSVNQAFKAGATDYLTKPLKWAILRQRVGWVIRSKQAQDLVRNQINLLNTLHRIDRELGYTLDIQRILDLAIDSAMRWSNATSCVLGWVDEDTRQLEPLADHGTSTLMVESVPLDRLAEQLPLVAALFDDPQPFLQINTDEYLSTLLVPLLVQGKPSGFIGLEDVPDVVFENEHSLEFLKHLSTRVTAAIEKVKVYEKTQTYALHLDQLYTVSTAISSHQERDAIIELLTQGLVVLLNASSAYFCAYRPQTREFVVENRFAIDQLLESPDKVPQTLTVSSISGNETLLRLLRDGPVLCVQPQCDMPPEWLALLNQQGDFQRAMLLPLMAEDLLLGVVAICDDRLGRQFLPVEISLARSLAAHGAVTLQQTILFKNIQELEQIKSEMIRMASHDLRNPVGQVMGFFDLLIEDLEVQLSEPQQAYVNSIHRGLDQIETLLGDILSLEQIERHQRTGWQPVDMHQLLQEVAENVRPQADLKSQAFEMQLPENPCVVSGSSSQLRQALTNLIANATKYTPEGGRIAVRSHVETHQFYFQVEDNGYGIPQKRQDRLFEPFYRARTPGTEKIRGTGLGLSMVKSIVERHGGQVWFKSELGQGSTFGLWLPVHQPETISD